jgi:hypothetical protein
MKISTVAIKWLVIRFKTSRGEREKTNFHLNFLKLSRDANQRSFFDPTRESS